VTAVWYDEYPEYVTVAERKAQAALEVEKLRKKRRDIAPVVIEGQKIAKSVWGKAWCDNLERYSDFETRLPRGRSYVRNGSVVHLSIARGKVEAMVSGSRMYKVRIEIAVAAPKRWQAICKDCTGSVGSLVELLQGKLSKSVMERVCRDADGLFPAPKEIKLSCSCPDWADMCKHVAAVMYGVGARLDAQPELLFALRGVDHADLIADAGAGLPQTGAASERILADDDMGALFGLDMEMPVAAEPPPIPLMTKPRRTSKKPAAKPAPKKKGDATRENRAVAFVKMKKKLTLDDGRADFAAMLSYKTPKELNKLAHFLSDVFKEATANLQVDNGARSKRKAATKSVGARQGTAKAKASKAVVKRQSGVGKSAK
jgi:uncharacterized Zn finger protein